MGGRRPGRPGLATGRAGRWRHRRCPGGRRGRRPGHARPPGATGRRGGRGPPARGRRPDPLRG
ncbi:MAG: hypothetical protein D6798_19835 [Deltaproteobacteria bacterium]|nr:MAG: hypothetical protein D6798_19835 [Deltaproteobacteria bacterium]